MKMDSLNKWLTLSANLGVLAGIIFLGLEIQQNSDALLAGSRQDLLEADLGVLDNLMEYPQLYNPATNDSLTGNDAVRREVYFVRMLRIREFAWAQYNNGVLEEQALQSYLEALKFVFNSDSGREYLLSGTFAGDPEFEKYILEYMGLSE
jgi:hypothetical protein